MSRLRFLRRWRSGSPEERATAKANAASRRRARFPRARRLRERLRPITRPLSRVVLAAIIVATLTSLIGLARSESVAVEIAGQPRPVVNEVTRLHPIAVRAIVTPRTTEELAAAIRATTGPIAIGGGRYSMGGQTATPDGVQLDLRELRGVVAFDAAARVITVRAGTRWRDVQRAIDGAGLAVKVMQTYNTFTVGGALSVNAHGRYIGNGPVVGTVRSIRLVLADGSIVDASPTSNAPLFAAAIGGYGGIGVITEATLDLAPNVKVRRDDETMPLAEYRDYFERRIAAGGDVVFHNADIYPPAYDRVHAVSYRETRAPLTVEDRIRPVDQSSRTHRLAYGVISGSRAGPWLREHVIDPLIFTGHPVTWRNYEASYDVSELEPASRARETYVLQEYFVPVDSLDAFVARMGAILRAHRVNVVNVSIRHVAADTLSLLTWAPVETYALVLYYKQGTDAAARHAVGRWTRELADAALAVDGRWYLPYQPHATRSQLARAYPGLVDYLDVKRRVDPDGRLTNTLWDVYTTASVSAERLPAIVPGEVRAAVDTIPGYERRESAELLTHPEWDLVYTSDAYAAWLAAGKRPSGFPYTESVGTFWRSYWGAYRAARQTYTVPSGLHVMLAVIGTSTAVEYGLKAAYENTVGRLAELAMPDGGTEEDRYAARVAADYGRLIHEKGWYEFSFRDALVGLWRDVPFVGAGMVRKVERRLVLSAEYGVKAVYATLIGLGTQAGYDPDVPQRYLLAAGWDDAVAADPALGTVRHVATLERGYALLTVPRYDPFRDALLALAAHAPSVRLAEVSGTEVTTLVANVPRGWRAPVAAAPVLAYVDPVDHARTRVLLRVAARDLLDVLAALKTAPDVRIEHVYDY